jgi:hypothetical protein
MTCPPPRPPQRLIEFVLVGGRHAGTRIEVPAGTTEVQLGECTYRRGRGAVFVHVEHEEEG